MSIQDHISSKRQKKLLIFKISNRLSIASQKISRFFNNTKPKIFFPYRSLLHTHPFFSRYYQSPPIQYSNLKNFDLAHWINAPYRNFSHINCVIESNDHPLSVTGLSEPKEVLDQIDIAYEIYSHQTCKRILVSGDGQLNLFKRYFPESIIKKTEIIGLGSIPKEINIDLKYKEIDSVKFICLASDYSRKAVDILLLAWLASNAKYTCKLIIACPNVPPGMDKLFIENNIQLIKKAPLSEIDKAVLHQNAHVSIAPVHTDGGTNIVEAFEFGLPVITMRSQRSFVNKNNGWEIDVPFYFYDEGYGINWRTWDEFWLLLKASKNNGAFDTTVEEFTKTLNYISLNPNLLFDLGVCAHRDASSILSLKQRNSKLLGIYKSFTG